MSVFTNIIIIGTGKIAETSLRLVLEKRNSEIVYVYEYATSNLSSLKRRAEKENVYFEVVYDRDVLSQKLSAIKQKTLIISANNGYVFPENVCNNPELTIINYHSALLPKYAGINATTWAIYHNEKEGGITWHYVDSQIDHGNILMQKGCEITNDMTALQLNRKYDQLATEALQELLPLLLENECELDCLHQDFSQRSVYKITDIPDDGVLLLENGTLYCYRVLRSMDYGCMNIFPRPIVKYGNHSDVVEKYKFSAEQKTDELVITSQKDVLEITDKDGMLKLWIRDNLETVSAFV